MFRTLHILVCACLLHPAIAQQSRQYSFKKFAVNDGLASNTVNRVVQDSDGYIWLATSNGLQRYDGSSFITFKPEPGNRRSVPDVNISTVYLDSKQRLWILAANKRAGIFDTRSFRFTEVAMPGNKSSLFIVQGFFELPGGRLVMLKSDGNFLVYDKAGNRFTESADLLPRPAGWLRSWVHWDKASNKYWMACDSGLAMFDPSTRRLNYRNHNPDNDPVIAAFADQPRPARTFTDQAGNLVFLHWPLNSAAPFIHRFNRKTGRTEKFSAGHAGYHEVDYFLQQTNGRLWVYGKPFMAEWKEKNGQPVFEHIPNAWLNEQSLRFDYMHHVYEDKQQNIWLATDNGLYVFNPDKQVFNTYYLTRPDGTKITGGVQSMAQLKDGRIFAGSWGSGGVTCYDKDFHPLPMPAFPYGEISTWDMTVHPKTGDLWIAMQGGSVVVLNAKTNTFKRVAAAAFGGSTVRQAEDDTSGNMWFGTQNGRVIKWDYKKSNGDITKGYEMVLQTGLVHKLHYDYSGYLWIGTLQHGLIKMDARNGKVVRRFTTGSQPGERLFSDDPMDMAYLNDSILLVAAGCLNIINTRTNQVTYITDADGLPSNTAVSVEKDKNGTIWLGMLNGICRVNIEKKLVSWYDRRDGIADDKFNTAGVRELADGRLSFFTDHSFMVFDPDRFSRSLMPAHPRITQFNLAGQRLQLDSLFRSGEVKLHHNNTSISISFSALSYLQQNKLQFYYMLEGLDRGWIRSDKPVQVAYNFLPPGNYTFKVKTENADGLSNPQIASLRISVSPPFWKSWWFISLALLLIVAILYLLDKERNRKRKALHQLRNQIRTNLKEEMSTALSNIQVLSKMAGIKADRDPELSKNFIHQITEKSRNITEVMNDTLWSIDPANDSMSQTLDRMREWSADISMQTGVLIDFSSDDKVGNLRPNMKLRHDLYILYKETTTFLISEAGAGQLFVNCRLSKSMIRLEIIAETRQQVPEHVEESLQEIISRRTSPSAGSPDILVEKKNISVLFQLHQQDWLKN